MYSRLCLSKILLPILIKPKRYSSSLNDDVFYDLTSDYNRKRFIHRDLLSNAIDKIHSNLSEKHSLLILTAAARYVHHVTPKQRIEFLKEIWKKFHEKNVRLTTRHYETYLNGLNENGLIFNPNDYLNEQIQATPRLYSLLLNQYCREGKLIQAEQFLDIVKEKHLSLDENAYSALIICHLKLGNQKQADEIIGLMKERHSPPTITTYKEILILLISEHKFTEFQKYFSQIDSEQSTTTVSTLYIDAQLILILLGQCLIYKESEIFNYLLTQLKIFDDQRMNSHLFNLAIQCLTNQWYESTIDLLEIQTTKENFSQKNWINFFKYLFDNQQFDLIEIFLPLMQKRNFLPLDFILHVLYTNPTMDSRLALTYLEQARDCQHLMQINYFYPLLLQAYTNSSWSETDHLRLYKLLNSIAYQIELSSYLTLFQEHFHRYYEKNFRNLFSILKQYQLESLIDRFCRLILHDIKHRLLSFDLLDQIAPVFKLQNQTRQEELAKYFYSIVSDRSNDQSNIFEMINKISKEIPLLKREIYLYLFAFSVQNHRDDLTKLIAEQCLKENLKFDSSINELHELTGHSLSDELIQQLSCYKPKEFSWKEKFSKLLLSKITRTKLEEIYVEAKENERYPISIQKRLLDIYIQKKLVEQSMTIFKEIQSNRYKIDSSTYHRLFNLLTVKLDSPLENFQSINSEYVNYLSDEYEKQFSLKILPIELTFRLAHFYLHQNEQSKSLKLLTDKIQANFNNEISNYLIRFLHMNSSLITAESLITIANLVVSYRPNESIRRFWNLFFDFLLNKTSPIDLVQFYSEAAKINSQIPYLHLFQLFIEKDELNRLQDIVDIATLYHGAQNVLHDLAFILIQNGKTKQAERIFQKSWLKARNDRINLHALLFADSNNLNALIDAIQLTKNLAGVNQKQLFTSAIRVAIRQEKSDTIDWLVKQIEDNQIQIDIRMKKYLDAHLLSKGYDRLNIDLLA